MIFISLGGELVLKSNVVLKLALTPVSIVLTFRCFWLCWVPGAAGGLSLVVVSRSHPSLWCMDCSLWWLLFLQGTGSRHMGFWSAGPALVAYGLAAPWHVGTFWTRDHTSVPCIARQAINHWATREALYYPWQPPPPNRKQDPINKQSIKLLGKLCSAKYFCWMRNYYWFQFLSFHCHFIVFFYSVFFPEAWLIYNVINYSGINYSSTAKWFSYIYVCVCVHMYIFYF